MKMQEMVKRMILSAVLTLAFLAPATAQTVTMADVFRQMPDSLMPYITHNDRLDMIDYLDAGMKAEVTNRFNGKSVLDTISTDYLHLTLSDALVVEMGVLPVEELTTDSCTHVVCVVSTYAKMESTLTFYTAKWQEWQPQPMVNLANMIQVPDRDCYIMATFGKSPEEIVLALSKPMLGEENIQEKQYKYRKNIKWTGKTFK
ncbi:MAG: DUF3256 family protein [Prevotella sp.]|nr:DUF3256 family protein [Prevotella sp.]